jgi:hypothetical protein
MKRWTWRWCDRLNQDGFKKIYVRFRHLHCPEVGWIATFFSQNQAQLLRFFRVITIREWSVAHLRKSIIQCEMLSETLTLGVSLQFCAPTVSHRSKASA